MASLKRRVSRQRDILIARVFEVRLHAERLHVRLRHPVVVIPAFLAGMFVARQAPLMLRALPDLSDKLRQLKDELSTVDAIIKLMAVVAPILPWASGVESRCAEEPRSRPNRDDMKGLPPAV